MNKMVENIVEDNFDDEDDDSDMEEWSVNFAVE